MAIAAQTLHMRCTVVMPAESNPSKIRATRELGAEVITDGVTQENREVRALQIAEERGLVLVHPHDDWDVIYGQSTVAQEILSDAPDVTTIIAPVGGGGLIAGIALAVQTSGRSIRVVGVEPETSADALASMHTGQREQLQHPSATIADGVRALRLGQKGFDVIVQRRLVDFIATVTEAEIRAATKYALTRMRLMVEPSGALSLAAVMSGKIGGEGMAVAVLSGGNIEPSLLTELVGHG